MCVGGQFAAQLDDRTISTLLKACAGLPLALKVVGKTSGDYLVRWKGQPQAIFKINELANFELTTDRIEKRLYGVLKWSFQLCDDVQKQAFLDIVAFYEPLRVPWEVVSNTLQEGTEEVGSVTFWLAGGLAAANAGGSTL